MMDNKRRKVIGVTGGLATGKTTVSEMFVEKGAHRIDADAIGHKILKENLPVKNEIIDVFGPSILTDDEIDRRKLAEKVFFSRENLDTLCRIMHPVIIKEIKNAVEKSSSNVIVIDAPLLIEVGLHEYVDIVVVVTADYNSQLERAAGRGITEKEARNIIEKQMPLSEKLKFADYIIDNKNDLEMTKKGVEELWKKE